ncbi:MAG: pentapeptide repeat-containing protein [Thaumarchaeota archaeon]|nr:pentapeptide repeat-containing protein [Nitrososphaerota archaeon]
MIVVVLNIMSGFFIQSSADENWKYVKEIYDPTGKYQCYIGEVPHGWAILVPCAKPLSENMTVTSESLGPSITFTPPVVPTITSITSSSSYTISGLSAVLTANVSPTPDSGAIQFYIDDIPTGNLVTVSGGQSTFSIPSLSVGLHHISASYYGASNFYASKSNQTSIIVLSTSDLRGANLSGIDIQGINLSGANMQGINLSGANMQGINLSKANLQDANLSGALLQGTKLKDSNLSGANLSGAILADSDISGANLSGANLKGANIKGANFTGATTIDCNGCPQIK